MLEQVKEILVALEKMRPFAVLAAFVLVVLVLFKNDISRVIDVSVLGNNPVQTDVNNDVVIQERLKDAMNYVGSNRASVLRFHNGIKYYSGGHKNRMSVDFEVTEPGVALQAYTRQNMNVTLYPWFIREIMLERMDYVDIADMPTTRARIVLEQQGVKSIAAYPYYKDNVLVAVVIFEWVGHHRTCCIPDDVMISVNSIGSLLGTV